MKKIFSFIVIIFIFGCSKSKNIVLNVEGIRKGKSYLISTNGMDTIFYGSIDKTILLNTSLLGKNQFPNKYNLFISEIGVFPIYINSGDTINISYNSESKILDVNSSFIKKMEEFKKSDSLLFRLDKIIKDKKIILKGLNKQKYILEKSNNIEKIRILKSQIDNIYSDLQKYNDSTIYLLNSILLNKKDKNFEDIFVYGDFLTDNEHSSIFMKDLLKILSDYNQKFKLQYIDNKIEYYKKTNNIYNLYK